MSNDLNFYINGEWVKSESNELIDVINPANEEIIGQVTAGTKDVFCTLPASESVFLDATGTPVGAASNGFALAMAVAL